MSNNMNKLCWCGSGIKFKKCHYRREEATPFIRADGAEAVKKSYSFRDCLCPLENKFECTGNIIKAHSISRSSSLEWISEEHHLISYGKNMNNLFFKDKFEFDRISTKSASTFTGFCGYHDRVLFEELDRISFNGSITQTELLAYRTTCREIFAKENAIRLFNATTDIDRGKSLEKQHEMQALRTMIIEAQASGRRDLNIYKTYFEKVATNKLPRNVRFINFEFDGLPIMAGSGLFTLHYDVNMTEVQEVSDLAMQCEHIAFSLIPAKDKSIVSMCWIEDLSSSIKKFLASLFEGDFNFGTIVWILLIHVENVFFKPSFINSLSDKDKEFIASCSHFGASHHDPQQALSARSRFETIFPAQPQLISSALA